MYSVPKGITGFWDADALGGDWPRYPNVGCQLLGQTVATAAGTAHSDLLSSRLAGPVGLDSFYAPATPGQLRPGAVIGRSRSGKPVEPWTGEALAWPAGRGR